MPVDWTPSYWMNIPPILGEHTQPRDGGIAVIGSGLTGASVAYWLLEQGFSDITLIDFEVEKSASLRNAGHILYGAVESMKALVELHGRDVAREIWNFSVQICHDVRETIQRLGISCDYKQDGYLVIAIDSTEDQEIRDSIEILREMGFPSEYVAKGELLQQGFRSVCGARFEPGSAQAHPSKFRNGLISNALQRGIRYHSGQRITAIAERGDKVSLNFNGTGAANFDCAVIAANAYSPLVSEFFASRRLVEPFRGQIITSKPLKHRFAVRHPHSFDHGYEYALVTEDNRLLIGGWRNHTPHGEIGTYDVHPNPKVEQGLKDFVDHHYAINEVIEWDYSWAGIMAASRSGFPYIGPTNSPRIFTCAGYTGHGFSWAHGSARLLAAIIAGDPIPPVARHFNPAKI